MKKKTRERFFFKPMVDSGIGPKEILQQYSSEAYLELYETSKMEHFV